MITLARLGRVALVHVAAGLLPSWSAAQAPSIETDEASLAMFYGASVRAQVDALSRGGAFFLALAEVLAALKVDHHLDLAGVTTTGFYLDEKRRFRIDFLGAFATIGQDTIPLPPTCYIATELELYVHPSVLEALFGWTVQLDPRSLTVRILSNEELPVELAARREQQRGSNRSVERASPVRYPRDRRAVQGAALDYFLNVQRSPEGSSFLVDATVGAECMGGDCQLRASGRSQGTGLQTSISEPRWRYVLGDSRWLSQLTVGHVYSLGANGSPVLGVAVTNHPFRLRTRFGDQTLRGVAPPGWEVEIFVDGRYMGLARADELGTYQFTIPLSYGTSRLKLRSYGPAGGLREEERVIQTSPTLVPAGQLDYAFVFGRLEQTDLPAAQAGITIGLARSHTIRLGLDYAADSSHTSRPMLTSSWVAQLGDGSRAEVELVPGALYRARVESHFRSLGQAEASANHYERHARSNPTGLRHEVNARTFLPIRESRVAADVNVQIAGRQYYDGTVAHQIDANLTSGVWGWPTTIAYARRASNRGGVRNALEEVGLSIVGYPGGRVRLRSSFSEIILRLNQTYDIRRHGPRLSLLGLSWFAMRQHVHLSIQYDHSQRRSSQIELGFVRELSFGRASSSVRHQPGGSVLSQGLHGSVGYDSGRRRIAVSHKPWVGNSGASFRLYLDENGSGRYDSGETLIPAHALRFREALNVSHDSAGVTRATGLMPYQRYTASIDRAAVSNPFWVPKFDSFSFETDPNRMKAIDVPFYVGGVLEGRVLRMFGTEARPVGGITIHVVSEDGAFSAAIETFRDGSFYKEGFPPGRYLATVDSVALRILGVGVSPDVKRFVLRGSAEDEDTPQLEFVLVPLPVQSQLPPAREPSGAFDSLCISSVGVLGRCRTQQAVNAQPDQHPCTRS